MAELNWLEELPLLKPSSISETTYRRAVELNKLINEKYADCVTGLWIMKGSSSVATELLLHSSLHEGEPRDLELSYEIDTIFNHEKQESDTYMLYDFERNIKNEIAENRDRLLSKLRNGYTVYVKVV